jgi:hypothetical protein
MGAEMWVFVLLLLMSFALFLAGRFAETERAKVAFMCSGVALSFIAGMLENDYLFPIALAFPSLSWVISDLIGILVLRRGIISPCVPAKKPQSRDENIVKWAFIIAVVIFSLVVIYNCLHLLKDIRFMGPFALLTLVCFVLALIPGTEICANGLWVDGKLQPWKEYESFVWTGQEDGVELRLVPNPLPGCVTRLIVPPEHREVARRILEANLPDLTAVKM